MMRAVPAASFKLTPLLSKQLQQYNTRRGGTDCPNGRHVSMKVERGWKEKIISQNSLVHPCMSVLESRSYAMFNWTPHE